MAPEEAKNSKSIPAGARQSSEVASPPPKLDMERDGAKPAYEHGHQPDEELEKSTNYAINVTELGTTQDQDTKVPRKSNGCTTRINIEKSRKKKRFAKMSSSRI